MENIENAGGGKSKLPRDGSVRGKDLDAMSAVDLAEELELIWGEMDEDTYDEELIDAYLDALDRKAPIPEHPDAKTAYRRFLDLTRGTPQRQVKRRSCKGVLRVALVAVVAVAAVFAAMITVQAAGVDVFGSIARWTKETFSFGKDYFKNMSDTPKGNSPDGNVVDVNQIDTSELSDFQRALNTFGITEVKEPSWIPEGYALDTVNVADQREFGFYLISASYTNKSDEYARIDILLSSYEDVSPGQIQNDSDNVKSIEVEGIMMYLIENENNITLTWESEKYEFQICGGNENNLTRIARSMLVLQ